jgi:cytochrome oxidase Cu insertion factor (SCO1/SenC/PrrC family)
MSKNFAELEQRLNKEFPGKFQLLSISMDPDFDRPEVLKSTQRVMTRMRRTGASRLAIASPSSWLPN